MVVGVADVASGPTDTTVAVVNDALTCASTRSSGAPLRPEARVVTADGLDQDTRRSIDGHRDGVRGRLGRPVVQARAGGAAA